MKIVFISQHYPKIRIDEAAKRLLRRGHKVHIVCGTSDPSSPSLETVAGVDIHRLYIPYSHHMPSAERIKSFGRFALGAGPIVRKIHSDVIYATSTPLTVIVPAIVGKLFRKTPIVFEVRDLWPDVPVAMGVLRSRLSRAIAYSLESVAYRSAKLVVPLSEDMSKAIQLKGISVSKLLVVPNASDLDVFRGHEGAGALWRTRHSWLGDRPLVAYCGTIGHVNNVAFLADVAKEALDIDDEVRFLVVGSGNDEKRVRARASSNGVLDRNFFMLPRVEKAEVAAILAASDVSVSTVDDIDILAANSANKVFDSFASGTPVVVNHGGWLAHVLHRTGAGLSVSGSDSVSAAREVVDFVRNPAGLAKAASAARELGDVDFNRDRLMDILISRLEVL